VLVPEVVGVPDRTPELLKVIPGLHTPEHLLSAHLYGVVPPEAVREVLYDADTAPLGSELGAVIVTGVVTEAITSVKDTEAV
jgi:hypothetical protein